MKRSASAGAALARPSARPRRGAPAAARRAGVRLGGARAFPPVLPARGETDLAIEERLAPARVARRRRGVGRSTPGPRASNDHLDPAETNLTDVLAGGDVGINQGGRTVREGNARAAD